MTVWSPELTVTWHVLIILPNEGHNQISILQGHTLIWIESWNDNLFLPYQVDSKKCCCLVWNSSFIRINIKEMSACRIFYDLVLTFSVFINSFYRIHQSSSNLYWNNRSLESTRKIVMMCWAYKLVNIHSRKVLFVPLTNGSAFIVGYFWWLVGLWYHS